MKGWVTRYTAEASIGNKTANVGSFLYETLRSNHVQPHQTIIGRWTTNAVGLARNSKASEAAWRGLRWLAVTTSL